MLYHLPPFTTINGILSVHFTCLTVLSYNLSPGPLWSTSWSWTLNFTLHTSFSLTPHIHLTILISARWSATTFSFLTGQVSLPCNMLLRTQLLYNLPLIIKDMPLLVSSGTSCLNLFQRIRILASTANITLVGLPVKSCGKRVSSSI